MNLEIASVLRRFFALFIDILILETLGALITIPLQNKLMLEPDEIFQQLLGGLEDSNKLLSFFLLYSTVLMLLWGFYFVIFSAYSGQTPGKKVLGLKIVQSNGEALNGSIAVNRFFSFTLSASCLFLGFLWALFSKNRQTWHDKLSGTVVIKDHS